MTAEEAFYDLTIQYGDKLHWKMTPFSQSNAVGPLVTELRRRLGADNPLFSHRIWAVAYNALKNEALYLIGGDERGDIYRIYPLFGLENGANYREFIGILQVKQYIEGEILMELSL